MRYTEFLITGAVNVSVRVTELSSGQFQFNLAVVTDGPNATGLIGELNGFYFNLPDQGAGFSYSSLAIEGGLKSVIQQNGVNNLSGGINVSGEVLKQNGGGFDAGVVIDWVGLAGGQGALKGSFVLADASGTLSLEHFTTAFAEQSFAVRLTSVGTPDGPRNDSLKLGGEPSHEILTDGGGDGDGDGGDGDPVNIALDDTMFVLSNEGFNAPGVFDPLDGFTDTLLFNDTTGDAPYAGGVIGVNGDAGSVGQVVAGSNGGLLIIYPDGRVDFSANDEFDYLGDLEAAETQFSYAIEGGATATLTVTVAGFGGFDDPFGVG